MLAGLPLGRPWFKHLMYAPSKLDNYGTAAFPGIVDALAAAEAASEAAAQGCIAAGEDRLATWPSGAQLGDADSWADWQPREELQRVRGKPRGGPLCDDAMAEAEAWAAVQHETWRAARAVERVGRALRAQLT